MSEWLTTASTDALQQEHRRFARERAWLSSRNRIRDAMGVGAQVVEIERELARRGEKPIIESIGPLTTASTDALQQQHRRLASERAWLRSRKRMQDAMGVGAQVVEIERELARRGEKPIIESIGPQPAAALAGPRHSDTVGWKQLLFSTVSIEWLTTASTDALQQEYRRLASERAWLRSRNRMQDAMGVGAQVVKIERELARRGEKPIIESFGPQPAAALAGPRRSDDGWGYLFFITVLMAFGAWMVFGGIASLCGASDELDDENILYALWIGSGLVWGGVQTWGQRFGWIALSASDDSDGDGDDDDDCGDFGGD